MAESRAVCFPLQCERIIVTGAGSGIGRGVSLRLAAAGATVFGLGRTQANLEETAQRAADASGRVVPLTCDIRDPDSVDRALTAASQDGPVPGLVHCAASAFPALAETLTPRGFDAVVSSSLAGAFYTVHAWATRLIDAESSGACVALTSALASRETPGLAHSSASKAGVEAMARTMAAEWGRFGIRLNVVGPGCFPTEGTDHVWARRDVERRMLGHISLGRYGKLQEIVDPIVFLLTTAAAYITGESIVVDGGLRLADWTLIAPGESGYERP